MTEYGLWSYNADGTEKFNPQKQTIKFMGTVTVSSANPTGSITDARFTAYANHKPYFANVESSSGSAIPPNAPVFTIVGNVLSWSYPAGAIKVPQKIVYGIIGTR